VIALPVLRNVRKINLRQPNASLQPDTLQTTCLLLKQKITGLPRRSAQRVGGSEAGQGRQFPARGSRGIADPPDSESGSLGRASRLAPTNFTPKQFERCTSSVWKPARCNSGWGLQFCGRAQAPQSIQCSGRFHTPAVPRAALETATISLMP